MFVQLFRTILIILIVYYLLRFIARYVLPWIAKYMIRKAGRDLQQEKEKQRRREGEINIDYKPDKKHLDADLGEYIDYEEITDKETKEKDNG